MQFFLSLNNSFLSQYTNFVEKAMNNVDFLVIMKSNSINGKWQKRIDAFETCMGIGNAKFTVG